MPPKKPKQKKTSLDRVSLPIPQRAKKELVRLRAEDRELALLEKNVQRVRAGAHTLRSLLTNLGKITRTKRKKRR